MTARTLIKRSLRFHWRSHLGVVLGAAIGSAALIGALIVGDSVRESLRERALERVGLVEYAWTSGDRLFRQELAADILSRMTAQRWALTAAIDMESALTVTATAARQDGTARANHVQVYGVTSNFFGLSLVDPFPISPGEVMLNESLAQQLHAGAGDEIVLRARKPAALSLDAPISPQNGNTIALRLRVARVLDARELGNFSLRVNQVPPQNAFMNLDTLASALSVPERANLVLSSSIEDSGVNPPAWWEHFPGSKFLSRIVERPSRVYFELSAEDVLSYLDPFPLKLKDAQLELRATNGFVELRSERIFLDPSIFRAATNPTMFEWRERLFDDAATAAETNRNLSATETNLLHQITNATPVLTYFVNLLRAGTNTTPYSMVCAAGSPFMPADMQRDEIIVNDWLAEDLQVKPGDSVQLSYFLTDTAQLIERTNIFRVRAVVPMSGVYDDRTLMPEFPGIAKAETTRDWDAGFPLVHKIRPKDDTYWKQSRGTPKAFVSLAAGQEMWGNRFGNLTGIRWPVPDDASPQTFKKIIGDNLLNNLKAEDVGIRFESVREQALRAAEQSQDFGGLFIGFSFFLIIAALILMALLFQFGLEQRITEIGTLLALGFRAKQVRRIFLLEGTALAFIGSVIGVIGGIVYAKLMLRGLTTIWRSATNTSALTFHVSLITVLIGLLSATFVAVITIWFVLRKQARQPARVLLTGDLESGDSSTPLGSVTCHGTSATSRGWKKLRRVAALQKLARGSVIAWASLALAVATVASAFVMHETSNPEFFFSAGSLCLIAGLAFTSLMLNRLLSRGSKKHVTTSSFAVRGAARRKTRSVATVALLASGVFLIASIGAFRLDVDADAWKRSSGTGGFALIGESTLPIIKDLNTREGRDALGLDEKILKDVKFVPFRVREGDDASCLNLNRAQQPRLLGVNANLLEKRSAFAFSASLKNTLAGWNGLRRGPDQSFGSDLTPPMNLEVAAIGDAASIQWALHKKIGDTIPYRDDHGKEFQAWLVGGLANSILQGALIIDEAEFTRRFPSVSGYRMFLIDCPSNALPQVSAELSRALQDYGFEVTPAAQRLAAFNAVQNTYLNTFQVLGGLGLLLGSFGLGIVVLRNVLERRGELALLIAVGFRRRRVQTLVLAEHTALLCLGLVIGIVSAAVAILPSLLSPRGELPVRSLALTLGGVLLFGMVSTWLATRAAVRGNLLEGLRNE